MSCLSGTPSFSVIQDDAYKLWETAAPSITAQDIIRMLGHDLEILGQHYFVPNPRPSAGGPAISPKWDFTSSSENGNALAYVIAAKVGDLPAPSGQCDVDWLELKNVEGELATSIYRVATKGGSPPPSVCIAGNSVHRCAADFICSALLVVQCCLSSTPHNTVSASIVPFQTQLTPRIFPGLYGGNIKK